MKRINQRACIFCDIINGNSPSWKVYEDKFVIAFFDINPANELHTLVVPKKHSRDIYSVSKLDLEHIIVTAKRIAETYKKIFKIRDINLIHGSGSLAQQDVFHFHIHIIPLFKNDRFKLSYKTKAKVRDKFEYYIDKIKNKIKV